MDTLDNLFVAFLDMEANKGLFRKELAKLLGLSPHSIGEPFMETELTNGVVKQYILVGIDAKLSQEDIEKIPFDYIEDGYYVFEVGDTVL
jgi:hypothetical protein